MKKSPYAPLVENETGENNPSTQNEQSENQEAELGEQANLPGGRPSNSNNQDEQESPKNKKKYMVFFSKK